ncbi:hypothetical protein [Vibrio nigripulchritudo]|uniref:hypothetical protein n=1 Tax=Vibrio nigripulchritudo TaxID=28173 RepID=UPI00249207AA|nr:hypothetical protein [Vibrio nigripulchritudo]BDU37647.1 hypothetical protein TUMSATVNIG2_21160 [Vibrio nigripulchritudo]BDU43367.1 hypothetical protein TUMSATVNIG3_21650 [Vibrio nigripulchritudo]
MKKFRVLLSAALLFASSTATASVVHWTVLINKVYVGDDTAKVFVHGAKHPNPGGSQWNCTSNLVSLGGYTDPIPASLKFSAAMEAYKSGTTARIGVEGSGTECKLKYITIN